MFDYYFTSPLLEVSDTMRRGVYAKREVLPPRLGACGLHARTRRGCCDYDTYTMRLVAVTGADTVTAEARTHTGTRPLLQLLQFAWVLVLLSRRPAPNPPSPPSFTSSQSPTAIAAAGSTSWTFLSTWAHPPRLSLPQTTHHKRRSRSVPLSV
ncbi:hypothetical protein B0H19DRAFT_1375759 [Mycena capillaripes]|nr:hypothetical protein B0H19DRAFT_1375759 [Mycena capillaripes]